MLQTRERYEFKSCFRAASDLTEAGFSPDDTIRWWTLGIDRKTPKALMQRENA